jgi:DNA-binding response OmpR family regulator
VGPRLRSDPRFGKDELIRDAWGSRDRSSKSRTLDAHAGRLRRKLDPDDQKYVVNCWGIGYRLVEG